MLNQSIQNLASFSDAFLARSSNFSHPTEWLDALRADDVDTARTILQSACADYKSFLTNGYIPSVDGNSQQAIRKNPNPTCSPVEFRITKPLHAAAFFHSHGVLRLLWESGVDILQVDSWHNNVVHILIYADSIENVRGARYVETLAYIQDLASEVQLKSLLLVENALALRPLEFAALHGCVTMALVIIYTKGVYLIREERVGYSVTQYFDLSDYELFDDGMPERFFNSPSLLADISHTDVLGSVACFEQPLLISWMKAKILINWPFILIWFLFRFFYISLFISAALENSWPSISHNTSDHNPNGTEEMVTCSLETSYFGSYLWYALAVLSIFIIICDFYNFLYTRKLYHPAVAKLLRRRDSEYTVFFYWMQAGMCLSIVGISACQILRNMGFTVPPIVDHSLFTTGSIGSMWSVVYFLQFLPWSSIYAIAIQRMLRDFLRFVLIFFLFLGAFAISFRRILLGSSNQCPKGFDTLSETIYSSFLVLLNLVNFRDYENADTIFLYILHIMFVFFISILLINFRIAVMTQSFSDVYANRRAIIQTQRLAIMLAIQIRLAGPLRVLYKRLQKNIFVYYRGRLCLRHTLNTGKHTKPISVCPGGNMI